MSQDDGNNGRNYIFLLKKREVEPSSNYTEQTPVRVLTELTKSLHLTLGIQFILVNKKYFIQNYDSCKI